MFYRQSLDKIVYSYLRAVASRPFRYGTERVDPPAERMISPLIFRDYTCPAICGGCCPRFSLVYLPPTIEPHPYPLQRMTASFNGREVVFYVDPQTDHRSHFCRNLDRSTGRCTIHGRHPFSCDFELLRFVHRATRVQIATQLFGHGWKFLRVDGERGARCQIVPPGEHCVDDLVRRLDRLGQWAEHCGITTDLPAIRAWVATGPHDAPLYLEGGPRVSPDENVVDRLRALAPSAAP